MYIPSMKQRPLIHTFLPEKGEKTFLRIFVSNAFLLGHSCGIFGYFHVGNILIELKKSIFTKSILYFTKIQKYFYIGVASSCQKNNQGKLIP